MDFMKLTPKKIGGLFFVLGCATTSVNYAAKPVDLSKETLPLSVVNSLAGHPSAYSAKVIQSHTDLNHMTHVRVQQYYQNHLVWGADAVVHVPAQQTLKSGPQAIQALTLPISQAKKNGIFYTDLDKDLASKQSFLKSSNSSDLVKLVQKQTSQTVKSDAQVNDEKTDLIVYVDKKNIAHWSYLVSYTEKSPHEIPKQPIAIVDAKTHEIYQVWDNIKTARPKMDVASGTGFGGNPLLGKWQYGQDKPSLPLTRSNDSQLCFMQNDEVAVFRKKDYDLNKPGEEINFICTKTTEEQTEFSVPEEGLFGQTNGAYSPINDALYYGMIIKKFYADWYGIPVLTKKDGTPLQLSMNLLYLNRGHYENAFWESSSQKMYFGLGGFMLYPLVTLGIAAHEISHGFTEQHSKLIYKDQSGALNEAFSDMVIAAVSYYASNEQETEWSTGSEVLKSNAGKPRSRWEAVRYFDKPSLDGYSIEQVSELPQLEKFCKRAAGGNPMKYQSCIVHLASGVFNKAFYELATSPGWNPKLAFEVMIKANQDYWTADASFQSAACGVKQAAFDIAYQKPTLPVPAVDSAFDKVGISVSDC